jgi:hypothetical protein
MLTEPLDERHPTRHNVRTPIWDGVQERLFAACRLRLDRSALYVRNAVRDARGKPSPLALDWGLNSPVSSAIADLADVIADGQPLLVLTFGQFAFELCRRALGEQPQRAFQHWTMAELGAEFRRRMAGGTGGAPLLVPLLHASIARGY